MKKQIYTLTLLVTILGVFWCASNFTEAQTVDELKTKIADSNKSIKQLEAEIEQYQSQLNKIGKEASTLQGAIKTLDLTSKSLATRIKVTENKISNVNLLIQKTSLNIKQKEKQIGKNLDAVAVTMRTIDQEESASFVERLLSHSNFSEIWNDVVLIGQFQDSVRNHVKDLQGLKQDLEGDRKEQEAQKKELVRLQNELNDQRLIVEANKKEKNKLLSDTKNTEANYKKLLAQRKATMEAFEKELLEYESKLQLAIDPNSFPKAGSGVLKWPLDKVFITQYYGNTAYSKVLYNGQGHNGIDFRAAVGTPVKAVLSGTVIGTGDTDITCPGASYGRWVLLRHANGLSTIYAHLSVIKVEKGDEVATGDLIAYSGGTGYATGPIFTSHLLHLKEFKLCKERVQHAKGEHTPCLSLISRHISIRSHIFKRP
jgi:murein DD-endopeptidase MepM/ murein hydrolase activator NlpD